MNQPNQEPFVAPKCRCGHAQHLHTEAKGCRAVYALGKRMAELCQHDLAVCDCEKFERRL